MNQSPAQLGAPRVLAPVVDPVQQALHDRKVAIHRLALLLHASVELGDVLGTLARHGAHIVEFDRFDLLLRDDNQVDYTLYALAQHQRGGLGGRPATRRDLDVHRCALGLGQPAVFIGADARAAHNVMRAAISVPIRIDGTIIGALGFHSREAGTYGEDELELAQLLSQSVAAAVRNAVLYRRELRRSHKLRALHHVGAAATTTLDRDSLLEEACRQISAEFGYYKVNLATIDDVSVRIAARHRLFYGRSPPPDMPADVIPRDVRSLMTTAANEQRIVHAPDVASDPQYYAEPGSCTRSEVAIPIVFRGRTFGILDLQSEQVNAFCPEDLRMLVLLANQLAAGLENCRLYDQVNGLLDTYVPAPVARSLRALPERPVAGGKRQRISVLFADLRGFTSHAEGRDPELLLQTLNDYLGIATGAITELGGTVDKFMGDGVMVMFNAPYEQPDHAIRAVKAALLIQQRMGERCREPGDDALCFGIGVNTGEVVVGNIGTSAVLNYTAIGDAVNVAKRLEEQARGGQVLVSAATHALVRDLVVAEPLGPLTLHNRRDPVDALLLRAMRASPGELSQ